MDELALSVPPGADGLIYCSGPTRQNPQRRNGFFGNIEWANSIPHRARSVLEGVLMDLYDPFRILEEGRQGDFIIGAGKGLQKSRIWAKIAADLFGRPVQITAFENAVFGAAIMAGLLTGRYKTLEEPVHSIKYSTEIIPDEISRTFYRNVFVNYWHDTINAAGLL
jgi:xylulokinase